MAFIYIFNSASELEIFVKLILNIILCAEGQKVQGSVKELMADTLY